MSDTPVLAIVGPTASGKSRVAMEVASRGVGGTHVEIVAVDAYTVYGGMDIGTAKPSAGDREAVAHHMVDVLGPGDELTVKWFRDRAREAIEEIRGRGAVPLLVGGSGLYFRAVVDDLRFPPTDPEVRRRLEQRYADEPEAAHEELAALDPSAAEKIEPANLRRSVRALEVIELTGRRFSSYAQAWEEFTSIYPSLEVGGVDRSTAELRRRIARRARDMVERGLLAEARRLRQADTPLSSSAAGAIGYAEAFAVLDGELDEGELVEAIEQRTWRYARRQRSWFRRDPRVVWAAPDEVVARWSAAPSGT